MDKKIKIFFGVLLFFAVAALRIPLSHVEAESASASDFQMKGDTLVKYTGSAKSISIPVSVKHIGKEAFLGHTELVRVEIPGYVESIDFNAFSGCSSLEKVTVPDTVKEIGNGAFSGCTGLKSVVLGKNLKKLGSGVFADCTSLGQLKLSKDNKDFSYDAGVIYSKDKTVIYGMIPGYAQDVYKMPSTVKTIKNNAFWGCANLKRVEIGNNVKEIPDYVFANCLNLEKATFPYSVLRIGIKSFADCINLGDIEIPISVSEIHRTAFDGCPKLRIIAEKGSYGAEYEEQRDKSQVAQSEYQDILQKAEESDAVSDLDRQEESALPGTKDTQGSGTGSMLGQSTVVGGNAVIFIDNSRSKVLSGNEWSGGTEQDQTAASSSEIMNNGQQAGGLLKYTIVNNKKIAAQAYYGNTSLTEYNVPDTITEIGDFAFARSGLTSITIPEGVDTIGYGAFYHCGNLTSVTIPESVTEIAPSAFSKTKWMEERLADRRNPFTVVGDGILVAYSGQGGKVTVPEGIKHIGAEVFKGKTDITSVTLPSTCLSVGEDAFAGCSSLVSISGGSYIKEIKDRAFAGCPISTIKIPASVESIGLRAFDITDTGKEDGSKIAVFLGKDLPKVSYEKTATRLINEEDRDSVFKDVRVAVVNDGITPEDVKDTVLDYDKGGFKGFVCSVEQTAGEETQGRLKIQFCVMKEEDVNDTTIPRNVTIYGRTYKISNPQAAVVYASSGEEEASGEAVTVESDSSTLPDTPAAAVTLSGSKGSYILKISDNPGAGSSISSAYRKAVPGSRMISLQAYDIRLYDAVTMIPISKSGGQQVTVTLPKPRGISADGLKVVCMDEDGQLEKVSSRLATIGGEVCVQFTAERFTTYGFYNETR